MATNSRGTVDAELIRCPACGATNRVPLDPSIHKTDPALLEAFQRVDWDN